MTYDELMRRALGLAMAQLGRTAPNPSVGCVLARGQRIVGEGATGSGGRPHAEEVALAAAGPEAVGAVAVITLEPCARRTSGALSCAERLAAAGVARVIAAADDPHPNAAGEGYRLLARKGVAVERGLLRFEAEALNAGFFSVVRRGRPLVAPASDGHGFDARFEPPKDADLEQALRAAAAAGLTRLWVPTNDPLANRLRADGLLDDGALP